MTAVLICSHAEDLEAALGGTLLWRQDVERQIVSRMEEARMLAVAARPCIVVIDRDLPWAARIVSALREDPSTRALSLVVMARGDFDASEVELLECGANAILRLPAGPEWNERLERLMDVPARKEARFPVSFGVEAQSDGGGSADAQALNLSASGMLIETEFALKVQDEVQLQFRLPLAADPVRVDAQVVRLAAPSQFGVEFRRVGPEEHRRIQGYLATLGG
jgi:DNA-binding response OmpR family regulator